MGQPNNSEQYILERYGYKLFINKIIGFNSLLFDVYAGFLIGKGVK